MFYFSLFNSSKAIDINSYECEPAPSILIPNKPESEKWWLIDAAEFTKFFFYTKLDALEYNPNPGASLRDDEQPSKALIT